MIPKNPMLHNALRDVAAHQVDFYPGLLGGHPLGYGWHGGGDVPQVEQDALAELKVVRLIGTIPARVGGEIGCEVVLTPQGAQILAVWESTGDGERR